MAVIIRRLRIENFRSIRHADLQLRGDLTPIIGLNSSGKSNILRALNLFFNGIVDGAGAGFDLVRDHSDFAPSGKRKKVTIGVEITLSGRTPVKGTEGFLRNLGATDSIAIQKTWQLPQGGTYVDTVLSIGKDLDSLADASDEGVAAALAILRSITYQFVPNQVSPADLIDELVRPLRPSLIARFRKTAKYKDLAVNDLMAGLGDAASRMFSGPGERVSQGLPGLQLQADVPEDFGDLVFELALAAVRSGHEPRSVDSEGSGAQAYALLHMLDMADSARRGSTFGWVKASIWALEEPESFLHYELKARYAEELAAYAEDPHRQVFLTTHDAEFQSAADDCVMVTLGSDGSVPCLVSSRDALIASARSGVAQLMHPLARTVDQPLVVTEGKIDFDYIRMTALSLGLRPAWTLRHPDDLFGNGAAGDALLQHLKFARSFLSARPERAPLVLLRDWDETQLDAYKKVLAEHASSRALVVPDECLNPQLGRSFAGIERSLPTEFVESVANGEWIRPKSTSSRYPLELHREHRDAFKNAAWSAILEGADPGDYLRRLVEWLDENVRDALTGAELASFWADQPTV